MILISHRGNTDGPHKDENKPQHIDNAIKLGFDVEIDLWYGDQSLYLGHDNPQYKINLQWLRDREINLWVHCKNVESLSLLTSINSELNYFWHQEDDFTLTSKNYIWTYPGKKLTKNSIAVTPEFIISDDILISKGICSDYVEKYKHYDK